jgi:aminoacyl-tRNA hydrolase
MDDRRHIIVGLGNPGRDYARNRHNIGFMVADALAEKHGLKFTKMMSKGIVALGEIDGAKVAIVKPQTFMNASGECVGSILKFYKSEPSDLLVMYDELDLPSMKLRLLAKGGAAASADHQAEWIQRTSCSTTLQRPNSTLCAKSSTAPTKASSAGCATASTTR